MSQRRMRPADTAFREPSWQAMHIAALQLLARVLSAVSSMPLAEPEHLCEFQRFVSLQNTLSSLSAVRNALYCSGKICRLHVRPLHKLAR